MVIGVNIKGDIKKATRFLTRLEKRQIPFATSLALNSTAFEIQRVEKATIKTDLDRPTKQVINSIRVNASKKRNLRASVFLLPWAHRFLTYQIEGGWREPRSFAEAVPVSIRLNKYGNIIGRRQGKLKKLLARDDVFSGTIRGISGIWQRGRGSQRNIKVKLLVAYEKRTRYVASRWPFYKYAQRTASRIWRREFRQAMRRALK